jgi:hypothetical protein
MLAAYQCKGDLSFGPITEHRVIQIRYYVVSGYREKIVKTSDMAIAALVMVSLCGFVHADEQADLAQQLANPVASLISVPFQLNYDEDLGSGDEGSLMRLNIQPVIPISLGEKWNLISRTILPVVHQQDLPNSGFDEFGLSDTVQSFFFSPKAPTAGGWIWGAGPAILLPTATDDFLGAEKWGIGPTAVMLKQNGPWTFGGLANHIESFAGDSDRADISATFLQPFVTYITPKQTTFALNTEATYDWETSAWAVPVNFNVNQLMRFGDQLVQIGGGLRYWVASTDNGAEGWGARLTVTLVFPR